ncbi:MAG: chorismate synthase [Nitrospiraceae bacterium]|nr:chorismate synthase [Nitrospiraceae bacterium]
MLRFYTAGESHGKVLMGIIEGVPSGIALSEPDIDRELKRRQKGYGRGGRMKIESDHAEIVSGVRWGITTGAPIGLIIENRDWANWQRAMSADPAMSGSAPAVTRPRPGHADLPGALKYAQKDIRNILERASARETAMRVALGAVARKLLAEFGMRAGSFVFQIGAAAMEAADTTAMGASALAGLARKAESSPVGCPDEKTAEKMKSLIDEAAKAGDTLGGRFTVFVTGLPPGLGSHIQWDRRLEGRLAQALMSIQAIKAVEVGGGITLAARPGSEAMDEIFYSKSKAGKGFYRKTNRMGGIEGGMTNGEPLVAHAAMKPIPTLKKPLRSVDMETKKPFRAAYERSDACAVPAAAVIAEAMAALVCAGALLEKTGGDSLEETRRNYDAYIRYLAQF